MTEREAAIVAAYTGILIGQFSSMHKYVEEILGRPVWTHQFPSLRKEIQDASRDDFIAISIDPAATEQGEDEST